LEAEAASAHVEDWAIGQSGLEDVFHTIVRESSEEGKPKDD
jgi:hypothetical protein